MLIVLAAFFLGLYRSKAQLFNDKWLLVFLAVNIIVKFSMLDDYDKGRINQLKGNLDMVLLSKIIMEYAIYYWFFVVGILMMLYMAWKNKKWTDYAGLLIIPVVLYCCTIDQVEIWHNDFYKYVFPISLYLLTTGMLMISSYQGRYKNAILLFVCLALITGVKNTIIDYHRDFAKRARVIESLISMCHDADPHHSKWFVSEGSLQGMGSWILDHEPITYSGYDHLPTTILLVRENDSLRSSVFATPYDSFYLAKNEILPINTLNPYYFHAAKGPYKELILDSERIKILREASQD